MSDKPGFPFQASIQIGERMALTVSGYLDAEDSAKEMESKLDQVFEAMQKQETKRMKVPAVKGALQDQKDALVNTKKRYEELAFQEQARKLNNAEKAQQETCAKQIAALSEQISKGEEVLAALEKEAA